MGVGGISIWQLLIILAIILLLFGGKRLRNLGGDLGTAIKGFRNSVKDESKNLDKADKDAIDVQSEIKSEAKAESSEEKKP